MDDLIDVDMDDLPIREADIDPAPPPVDSWSARGKGCKIVRHENGAIHTQGSYMEGNIRHGRHQRFSLDGQLLSDHTYSKGVPAGAWYDWDYRGEISAVRTFDENGRPHGTWIENRENSMFDMHNWDYTTNRWDHGLPLQTYKWSFFNDLKWFIPVKVVQSQGRYYIYIREDTDIQFVDDSTTSSVTIVYVEEGEIARNRETSKTRSGTYFYGEMPTYKEKENQFSIHFDGNDCPWTILYRIDCRAVRQWTDIQSSLSDLDEYFETYFVERAEKFYESASFESEEDLIKSIETFIADNHLPKN